MYPKVDALTSLNDAKVSLSGKLSRLIYRMCHHKILHTHYTQNEKKQTEQTEVQKKT